MAIPSSTTTAYHALRNAQLTPMHKQRPRRLASLCGQTVRPLEQRLDVAKRAAHEEEITRPPFDWQRPQAGHEALRVEHKTPGT